MHYTHTLLCKGTEPKAGAALAGAVVEQLSQRRCSGIFATHLHGILELPFDLSRVDFMAMEMAPTAEAQALQPSMQLAGEADGQQEGTVSFLQSALSKAPSWRLIQGVCTESLAYKVAHDVGIPEHIIERAMSIDAMRNGGVKKEGPVSGRVMESVGAANTPWGTLEVVHGEPMELQRGMAIVGEVAAKQLHGDHSGPTLGTMRDSSESMPVIYLHKGAVPSPSSCGRSCVYLVCTAGGLYCGETDDIYGRSKKHQSASDVHGLAYIPLPPPAGKSEARSIEARAIQVMRERGIVLVSDTDGQHRQFTRHHIPRSNLE
jgi:hypothetical protein